MPPRARVETSVRADEASVHPAGSTPGMHAPATAIAEYSGPWP